MKIDENLKWKTRTYSLASKLKKANAKTFCK